MRKLTSYLLATSMALGSLGCTAFDNVVRGTGNTIGNIALAPYKITKTTVEEFDPVKGVRRAGADVLEETGYTLTAQDSARNPQDYGKLNEVIEESPLAEFIVDSSLTAGAGAIVGYQATSIFGGGQDVARIAAGAAIGGGGEVIIKAASRQARTGSWY